MENLTKHKYFPYFIIVVFVFLLYGNTINHNYNFDDEYVILNQQVQKGLLGIPEIFTSRYHTSEDQNYGYRPIAKSTFAIEYFLFGLNPNVSHFLNLLLYTIGLFALFRILNNWLIGEKSWLSFLILLLFASHPVHSEVVSSLKNREILISLFFGFLGLISVFKYIESKKISHILISVPWFSLSILSKESGFLFFAIGLFDLTRFYFNQKLKIENVNFNGIKLPNTKILKRKEIQLFIFFYFIIILFLFIEVPGLVESIPHVITFLLILVVIPLRNKKEPFIEKNLKIQNSIWIYLVALVGFHYTVYGLLIFFIGFLLLIAVALYRFLKMNSVTILNIYSGIIKPYSIMAITLLGISCISILAYQIPRILLDQEIINPMVISNPIENNSKVFSRIAFSASVLFHYLKVLIAPTSFSFYYGFNTLPIPKGPEVNSAIGLLILIFCGILTLSKSKIVSFSSLTIFLGLMFFSNLFFDVPGIVGERLLTIPSIGFCILLGLGLFQIKLIKSKFAKPAFWILTISILSFYSFKTIYRNKDWKNKGTLYAADIEHLQNSARANLIYGDFLFGGAKEKLEKTGISDSVHNMFSAAALYYERSLNVDPSNYTVKNNLGTIYYSYLNKKEKGKNLLKQSLSADFANYYAFNNLGTIYENESQLDSAIIFYQKGQKLKPDNFVGVESIGLCYYQLNEFDSAFKYFEKTLELNSRKLNIHLKMGDLLTKVGQPNNAVIFYNYALQIEPTNQEAIAKLKSLNENEN